jgi:hypothetical protein
MGGTRRCSPAREAMGGGWNSKRSGRQREYRSGQLGAETGGGAAGVDSRTGLAVELQLRLEDHSAATAWPRRVPRRRTEHRRLAARSGTARTVRRRHKAAQEQGRTWGLAAAQLNRRAALPCLARTPGRTSVGLRRSSGGGRHRMGLDGLRAGYNGAGLAMRAGVG